MSDFREEEALGKVYDSRLARRLFRYLRPYRGWVIIAGLLTLPVAPLAAIGPKLFEIAVDRYFVPVIHGQIPGATAIYGLGWISLIYLVTLVLGFAFMYFQVRVMQKVGQDTMYDMRKEIFEHLQRLPISFYDRSPVGRLVTRVTTDVDALNDLFATGIAAMVNDAFLLVLFIFIMLEMNWKLALDTLAVLPCILVVTYVFRQYVREANRNIPTPIAKINSFLQEYISGMSIVRLFNREQKARDEFAKRNQDNMLAWRDAILSYALFYPAVEILSVFAIALIYWAGGNRVLGGALSLGVLTEFTMFATRFFRPIQDLSEKFNILQSAMAASEGIFKLPDEPANVSSPADAIRLENPRGEIEFRNVWFSYRPIPNPGEDDWVLRDVWFRVDPGQTLP